jgi:hypothetical protein
LIVISLLIKQRLKTNVTVISPLRIERNEQQLDQQILINGRIMVFQFKKPISYTSDRNDNYTKFIIKTEQHYNLLRSLRNKQAFYIFVALNNISEIKSNRTDITLNQRSRVLRMVKSSLAPKMELVCRNWIALTPNMKLIHILFVQVILIR